MARRSPRCGVSRRIPGCAPRRGGEARRRRCAETWRLPGVPALQGHCRLPVLRTSHPVTGISHGNHG
jgi:hypothetical protein